MSRYLTEFVGTFFLVLTVGLATVAGLEAAPLAIGCTLTALVYMGRPVSGAHYNPAVSLALLVHRELSVADFVAYVFAQIVAACFATLATAHILGQSFAPTPAASASGFEALLVECLFTFLLGFVIFHVAVNPAVEGNSYYGMAIGMTIAGVAYVGGPISGGAYNPAVGIGPTVIHALLGGGTWAHLWIYIVGPLSGGVLAQVAYKLQLRQC